MEIYQIYKLYVATTDQISSRRQTTNTFFLSINSFLITLWGVFYSELFPISVRRFVWLIGILGMIISYNWYIIIKHYSRLNSAKFKVISKIENNYLPFTPFNLEWEHLGRGKDKTKYIPLSKIERKIALIFLTIHFLLSMALFLFHFQLSL